MAALLRGADHCTLRTLQLVTERLGLSIRVESVSRPPYLAGPVETIVDRALRGLAAHVDPSRVGKLVA